MSPELQNMTLLEVKVVRIRCHPPAAAFGLGRQRCRELLAPKIATGGAHGAPVSG
ncbi:MAG: hypothetical protein L0I62_05660 [Gammaproteobacteria bacterium]|nr:hypothetical protein [Gammaproteobacteria bacterium]